MSIRTIIYTMCELPKQPEEMTLREAVEWHKKFSLAPEENKPRTQMESDYIQGMWVALIEGLCAREGVPTGYLSYFLDELARTETMLTLATKLEAQAS